MRRLKPPGFPAPLLTAIDAGLATRPDRRPQSVAQWRGMMGLETWSAQAPGGVRRRRGLKPWLGAGIAAAVLAAGAGSYFFLAARHSGEVLQARLSDLLARSAPTFSVAAREAQVTGYLAAGPHKALAAFHPSGSWRSTNVATAALAEERVLEACQIRYGDACALLAVDEAIQPPEVAAARRPMERVAYAGSFDPHNIPAIGDDVRGRKDVGGYRGATGAKAAALHPSGHLVVSLGAGDQRDAEEQALSACNGEARRGNQDGPCFLYAIADEVVLARRAREPISAKASAPVAAERVPPGKKLSDIVEAVSPHIAADSRQSRIASYLAAASHKALAAFPPSETWQSLGWTNAAAAEEGTLEGCQLRYGDPCVLLAVDEVAQSAEVAGRRRTMPRVAYAGPFAPEMVPAVTAAVRARADVVGYRASREGKAAALHPSGQLFIADRAASQREAEERVLSECNADPARKNRDGPCLLYSVGDQVVLPRRATAALTPAPPAERPSPEIALRAALLEQLTRVASSSPIAAREKQVASYLAAGSNKAIAGHASGSWRASSDQTPQSAEQGALEGCEIVANAPCVLLAVNYDVERLAETPARQSMARVAYQGTFDPSKIPIVVNAVRTRQDVAGYRTAAGFKAVALHPWGRVFVAIGRPSQWQAEEAALAECNALRQTRYDDQDAPCYLYAAGDQVVLSRRATAPVAAPPAEPPNPEMALRAALLEQLTRVASSSPIAAREKQVASYLAASSNKAIAGHAAGSWRASSEQTPQSAEQGALEGCEIVANAPCVLLAINYDVERLAETPARQSTARVAYQGTFDPSKIPIVVNAVRTRQDVAGYRTAAGFKAVALHPWGRVFVAIGRPSQWQAEEAALAECNASRQTRYDDQDAPCYLYAAGDQVVLSRRATAPIAAPPVRSESQKTETDFRSGLASALSKAAPYASQMYIALRVSEYLDVTGSKAIAAYPTGIYRSWGWESPSEAEDSVLEQCQVYRGLPCLLIAVNTQLQSESDRSKPRAMPKVGYDGPFYPAMIPAVVPAVRKRADVVGYRAAVGAKAVAFHPNEARLFVTSGAASEWQAEDRALSECNADSLRKKIDGPCYLYATGDSVVLPRRSIVPIASAGLRSEAEAMQSLLRSTLLERWAKVTPSAPLREFQVFYYLTNKQHKALSSSPFGSLRASGWPTAMAAEERSLEGCQVLYGEPCQLIVVDETVQSAEAAARKRAMPRVLYDGPFDPQRIPAVTPAVRTRADVAGYGAASGPKAAALHGAWGTLFIVTGAASQREAEAKALADCNTDPQRSHRDGPCLLYAVASQVVLPRRATAPLTAQ